MLFITIGEEQNQNTNEISPNVKLNAGNHDQTVNLKIFSGVNTYEPMY